MDARFLVPLLLFLLFLHLYFSNRKTGAQWGISEIAAFYFSGFLPASCFCSFLIFKNLFLLYSLFLLLLLSHPILNQALISDFTVSCWWFLSPPGGWQVDRQVRGSWLTSSTACWPRRLGLQAQGVVHQGEEGTRLGPSGSQVQISVGNPS